LSSKQRLNSTIKVSLFLNGIKITNSKNSSYMLS
jgi:hypothetical protein